MNVLMIYPKCPSTFWSNDHFLSLFRKKGNIPPLGLLTVASLLPDEFNRKIIDMNYAELSDEDILWSDYVFVSAMIVQKDTSKEVFTRCRNLGVKIVAGGPLFTAMYDDYPEVDHFLLGEGEATIPMFLEDLKTGNLKRFYISDEKPDIKKSPIPRYDLVDITNYFQLPIQFSRGCPYDCEFCEITSMNGRIPRNKTPQQVITELEFAINLGWKGRVFFIDDNFIANKQQAKELLKKLAEWRKQTNFQSLFLTQLSINAADEEEMLELLRDAGFSLVFIGIETPSSDGLKECGKLQNQNINLIDSVRKFYRYGIKVAGGFIVGFDSDDETIFRRQLNFIQEAGVSLAMIGMLNALPNTSLKKRLQAEGRILDISPGSNTDFFSNIEPKMGSKKLIDGYKSLMKIAYSPKMFYERILNFVKYYNPVIKMDLRKSYLLAGALTIIKLGFFTEGRIYFWRFVLINLLKYPKTFLFGIESAISYVHLHKIYKETLNVNQ